MPSSEIIRVQHVSFPRSGHHLLVACLLRILRRKMKYCEYYNHCRRIPCIDPETNYQKNHDFRLRTAVRPDLKYIVQVRHPIESIASWFDLSITNRHLHYRVLNLDRRWYWRWFFANKLAYWKKFVAKWMPAEPAPNMLYVSYDNLVRQPIEEVERVLAFIRPDLAPDRQTIEKVVTSRQVGRRREVTEFRYFDRQWMRSVESSLQDFLEQAHLESLEYSQDLHHADNHSEL